MAQLPVYPPRSIYLDTPDHVGRTISFADAAAGVPVQIGTVPVGSVILQVFAAIDTAFNAGTTNTITLGTTQANANELMQAGDNTPGAPGFYPATRGLGNTLTQVASGPSIVAGQAQGQDTCEGGVGIWMKVTGTGTTPTTGHGRIGILYVPAPST